MVAIVVIVALAVLVALGGSRGFLGGPPPRAKQTAGVRGTVANAQGAHSPSGITRIIFGIMDKERTTTNMYTRAGGRMCTYYIYYSANAVVN